MIAKIIFETVLFITGASIAIPALIQKNYITMLFGFAITGAFGIFNALNKQQAKEADYEKRHGARYNAYMQDGSVKVEKEQDWIDKIIAIMIALFATPIATPVSIIINVVHLKNNKKDIAFWNNELNMAS